MTGNADLIKRAITSGRALAENSRICVAKHHGVDLDAAGDPPWLRDCAADIEALTQAADALEAAERVIGPFAEAAGYWHETMADDCVISEGLTIAHLRAAKDWLARHATGQRKGGDDDS